MERITWLRIVLISPLGVGAPRAVSILFFTSVHSYNFVLRAECQQVVRERNTWNHLTRCCTKGACARDLNAAVSIVLVVFLEVPVNVSVQNELEVVDSELLQEGRVHRLRPCDGMVPHSNL